MAETRAELEAAIAAAQQRRETIHARALVDLTALRDAQDRAQETIDRIVTDTAAAEARALGADAAAEADIERLTAELAALPKET